PASAPIRSAPRTSHASRSWSRSSTRSWNTRPAKSIMRSASASGISRISTTTPRYASRRPVLPRTPALVPARRGGAVSPGGETGVASPPDESGQALHVVGHREGVEGAQGLQRPAALAEVAQVAGEGGGVAGHVGDLAAGEPGDLVDDLAAGARAGRVEDDDVGAADALPAPVAGVGVAAPAPRAGPAGRAAELQFGDDLLDGAALDGDVRQVAQVEAGVPDGLAVGLDADDEPGRPDAVAEDPGVQAGAAVQVEGDVAG